MPVLTRFYLYIPGGAGFLPSLGFFTRRSSGPISAEFLWSMLFLFSHRVAAIWGWQVRLAKKRGGTILHKTLKQSYISPLCSRR